MWALVLTLTTKKLQKVQQIKPNKNELILLKYPVIKLDIFWHKTSFQTHHGVRFSISAKWLQLHIFPSYQSIINTHYSRGCVSIYLIPNI